MKFGGFCWRIIRINGDGTLRIIYDGTSCHANGTSTTESFIDNGTTTAFNSSNDQNAYVGYTYGTPGSSSFSAEHYGSTNSTIKGKIDTWYDSKLASYASKISDTAFCGDRTIDTTSGYNNSGTGIAETQTGYGARLRLYTNKTPQLTCANKQDRYTVDDTTTGNGILTYPVGLITADEVAMAGGVFYTKNSSYYLNSGYNYWTMSPYLFDGSDAALFCAGYDLGPFKCWGASPYNVRPVVSLKSSVTLTGSGTQGSPFVVQ